jgi:hypothetical protein
MEEDKLKQRIECLELQIYHTTGTLNNMRDALDSVDELLSFLEDTAHGEEGNRITIMRHKILPLIQTRKFLKQK